MDQQEILYSIALTRINYFKLTGLLQLYRKLGSATSVIEHRNDILDIIPDASPRLIDALKNIDEPLKRAEVELKYDSEHNIQALPLNDERYPQRLKNVDDAPIVLFYKGNANLNPQRVINIIGTRQCTVYGQDLIRKFVADLKGLCPNTLIVSGLAYGVDVNAHRFALQNGFETVGVLAHGLDTLYPSAHRQTANEMIHQGGLLTEFLTMTNADKINFVRRNRIVAGMSDACILVESAAKGGGLITTEISQSYGRDVFAFPGRIGDHYSEGCNNLIRDNGAGLITSAKDFVNAMGWQDDAKLANAQKKGIQREMFPELNEDEKTIVRILQKNNDLQINILTVQANIPIHKLTALLFDLEMKGVVKELAGGMYHLLNI
ncbi:DNA-processing protein DprA [Segatella albensis]|uniref:DNA-processing protein DprA n=1 Tax=Segatella albensis TaxID=77768 RepID=UPI0003F79934|nr:DNA-processing protein DprA [Segatella albensis]